MRKRLLCATLCAASVILWQWLTVHYNYGGTWNALFETGALRPIPPDLAAEHIYTFANSYGYDGQFYHLIAHDPLFRKGYDKYVDEPRLRYRRILMPAIAELLALGRPGWIDGALILFCWISIFAGAWWLAAYAALHGRSPYWGFLFLLFPAVVVSVDRMVADVALAALTVAFALFSETDRRISLFLTLVAAALTRETGLLLPAGYLLFCVVKQRWRDAIVMSAAAVPCLAWYEFVRQHTRPFVYPASAIPGSAWIEVLRRPTVYPEFSAAIQALDAISLASMAASFALALFCFRRLSTPAGAAAVLFALAGIFFQKVENWRQLYDYGRVYTPVLVFLALLGLTRRAGWTLVPLLIVLPRLGAQLIPQIVGVARAIFPVHQ